MSSGPQGPFLTKKPYRKSCTHISHRHTFALNNVLLWDHLVKDYKYESSKSELKVFLPAVKVFSIPITFQNLRLK